jgi:pimeloyl-ACP methyl ester carboxylesterase
MSEGGDMEITSRGHRIAYTVAGHPDDPTLLLVHGILQSAQRWADMGYLDAFAPQYRVVAVDLLGHGRSDKPTDPADYSVDGHVQDLLAVLTAEGAAAWHVWGYSGGALLAVALTAAHPEGTLSMLIGGVPGANVPRELREAVVRPWIDALGAGDWDGFWGTFHPIDEPTKALMERTNDPRSVAAWLTGALATGCLPELGDVPMLVYMGDEEILLDDARTTARHLGAEFATIPGRGHVGAFQDLAAVEPIARAFLSRAGRASALTHP